MGWEKVIPGATYRSQHTKCPRCGANSWKRCMDGQLVYFVCASPVCPSCAGTGFLGRGKTNVERVMSTLQGEECRKCGGDGVATCGYRIKPEKVKPFLPPRRRWS